MAAIAALADRLAVPVQHVHEIYRKELGRLAADARIDAFLDVLALGRTRGILREQTGLANRYRGANTFSAGRRGHAAGGA